MTFIQERVLIQLFCNNFANFGRKYVKYVPGEVIEAVG